MTYCALEAPVPDVSFHEGRQRGVQVWVSAKMHLGYGFWCKDFIGVLSGRTKREWNSETGKGGKVASLHYVESTSTSIATGNWDSAPRGNLSGRRSPWGINSLALLALDYRPEKTLHQREEESEKSDQRVLESPAVTRGQRVGWEDPGSVCACVNGSCAHWGEGASCQFCNLSGDIARHYVTLHQPLFSCNETAKWWNKLPANQWDFPVMQTSQPSLWIVYAMCITVITCYRRADCTEDITFE